MLFSCKGCCSVDSIPWLIQDDNDNITRYLVLARDPIMPRTNKPFKARDHLSKGFCFMYLLNNFLILKINVFMSDEHCIYFG